jgi:hypothetical protein
MTEREKLATLIGEFVFTEMEDVRLLEYHTNENNELTAFTIVKNDGKRYDVNIEEVGAAA